LPGILAAEIPNPDERTSIMKRIPLFLSLVIILSLLLTACGATSGTHLDAIKKAGTIKVGTSADYPPFEYVDAQGNKIGFDIELMAEVAKRMNLKLEWVDMPFDSLIAGVKEGKIDASISAFNYSEERDQEVDFTEPYYIGEDGFTVADTFTGTITKPEDVATLKVGVQSGTTQDSYVTDTLVGGGILPEGQVSRYERADQVALDLKNGRIDVMMTDLVPAQALAKQLGGLKIIHQGLYSSGPFNIVVPQDDKELAEAINAVLKDLQAEGFIDNLAIKYFVTE
jgi:polar amino acid transport system substrate-binding protein